MHQKFLLTPQLFVFALTLMLTNAFAQIENKEIDTNDKQNEQSIPVSWENFAKAETHKVFKNYASIGGFGKFFHIRAITPIDKQDIIRMNRDTRYSIGIFDLTNPLTVKLPNTKGRFISMQVLNEEEYTKAVEYNAGDYKFTQESVGSRYVCLIIRILVNGEAEADNQIVTEIQNQISVEQRSIGIFEIPNWNQQSLDKMREAIKVLGETLTDGRQCFGDKDEVNPIAHLLGVAWGWGGNPIKDAVYLNVTPQQNDGKTPYQITLKDVPVDGFWSVSVYNKAGYFEKNPYDSYTVNSVSALKNRDGSITIHFGGDDKQVNFIPITEGWNYIVRLYRARNEVINGTWVFPNPIKVN
ncbi:MAG: DUF1214 domain-containing protein [Bacteroidales bacterium]